MPPSHPVPEQHEIATPAIYQAETAAPAVKVTVHPPKPFKGDLNECEHFIRKVKQYLKICKVPPSQHIDLAATYLEGQPDKLWATESEVQGLL